LWFQNQTLVVWLVMLSTYCNFEKENGYAHVLTWFYLVSKICAFAKPTSKSLLIYRKISPSASNLWSWQLTSTLGQAPSTSNFFVDYKICWEDCLSIINKTHGRWFAERLGARPKNINSEKIHTHRDTFGLQV